MHILKIIHGYPMLYNAGSEVYSQSICNQLSKTHQVSIFSREADPFRPDFEIRKTIESPSRTLYHANMPREKDGYRHDLLDQKFQALLEEIKPDIAHIGHLNHLSTGLVDALNRAKIPIVFTLHDFWLMCPRGQFLQRNFAEPDPLYKICQGQEDRKCATTCYSSYFSGRPQDRKRDEDYWTNWIGSRMEETKALPGKIDLFLAPSRYLMDRFIQDFNMAPQKVSYLDYGFPLHYLHPPEVKQTEEFTFGYIGTHIPAKGIDYLIRAFSQIKGNATLRIWGRERAQETTGLKTLSQTLVKEPLKVEWMGEYINREISEKVFQNCDAIVVPSIWGENSPLVIHEAQACHVPVITADIGGMQEYVSHRVNGLLFEHRNSVDLAQQMQWALEHPTEMQKMGQRGYLFSDNGQIPDIETHCSKLQSLYQRTIENHEKQILASHA